MLIVLPIKKALSKNGNPEYTFKVLCANDFGYTCEVTEDFTDMVGGRYLKKSKVAKVQTYIDLVSYIKGCFEFQGHDTRGIVFCENDVNIR